MSQILTIPTPLLNPQPNAASLDSAAVRTETVYVVFTSIDDTLAAVRVARAVANAMSVPLTLIHFRIVPFALPVDRPTGVSPLETEDFVTSLRAEGVDARVRVYLCRDEGRTMPFAFKPRSLIVMAGRHSWFPTHLERWRRTLEAAGHSVIFVDTSQSSPRQLATVTEPGIDREEVSRA